MATGHVESGGSASDSSLCAGDCTVTWVAVVGAAGRPQGVPDSCVSGTGLTQRAARAGGRQDLRLSVP
ncbi:MAG: hypothetical protein V5A56_15005, partial [Halolamina sp.]